LDSLSRDRHRNSINKLQVEKDIDDDCTKLTGTCDSLMQYMSVA